MDDKYVDPIDFAESKQQTQTSPTIPPQPSSTQSAVPERSEPIQAKKSISDYRMKPLEYFFIWPMTLFILYTVFKSLTLPDNEAAGLIGPAFMVLIGIPVISIYWIYVVTRSYTTSARQPFRNLIGDKKNAYQYLIIGLYVVMTLVISTISTLNGLESGSAKLSTGLGLYIASIPILLYVLPVYLSRKIILYVMDQDEAKAIKEALKPTNKRNAINIAILAVCSFFLWTILIG